MYRHGREGWGDLWTCSKIAPDLRGSGTGHRSSIRSVSWSSLIVSWSYESGTTQRVLSGCRISSRSCPLYVCSAHDWLTLWSSSAYDPTPTKADWPPINLRCTPTSPDPYTTRLGLFPLNQWGCAGEATHKGSLKVSLGFWQGRRPLNIRVASFKKSIPCIHPFPLNEIYSTEDVPNWSADNVIFLCVLLKVQSVQLTTLLHWNSSVKTVCCSRMTCCFKIWTKSRAPYTGSLAPMDKN